MHGEAAPAARMPGGVPGAARPLPRALTCGGRARHPNIIRLLDSILVASRFYFVMEYASGGSLVDFVRARVRAAPRRQARCLRGFSRCAPWQRLRCLTTVSSADALSHLCLGNACVSSVHSGAPGLPSSSKNALAPRRTYSHGGTPGRALGGGWASRRPGACSRRSSTPSTTATAGAGAVGDSAEWRGLVYGMRGGLNPKGA